jgi:hypothetical protein
MIVLIRVTLAPPTGSKKSVTAGRVEWPVYQAALSAPQQGQHYRNTVPARSLFGRRNDAIRRRFIASFSLPGLAKFSYL